jgi:hypothetical protein
VKKKNPPRDGITSPRRVDLENYEASELRPDCVFLDRFAFNGKAGPDQSTPRTPEEGTEATVRRLLSQVCDLLGRFERADDASSHPMALQGLALFAADILELVRERTAPTRGAA